MSFNQNKAWVVQVVLILIACNHITGISFEDDTTMTFEQKEILDKVHSPPRSHILQSLP